MSWHKRCCSKTPLKARFQDFCLEFLETKKLRSQECADINDLAAFAVQQDPSESEISRFV